MDSFRADVIAGLSLPQKALPPKYFYDAKGSRLFEAICRLKEYYPTRSELALTRRHIGDIARFASKRSLPSVTLIEYGSGESLKSRMLIDALRPAAYIPVDISEHALRRAAASLPNCAAMRSCRALTVGSSPKTSSPNWAVAMAASMAGVGRVTVSLRRSISVAVMPAPDSSSATRARVH